MNIIKKIKELMEERRWSEYRLSKESGLSQSTIRNLFTRNNLPTFQTLEAICDAFGITLAQFFSEGSAVELTEEQQMLLKKWAAISKDQQQALLVLLDTMK
ncbi:helix-turn-helix transcriptional regulator [Emergencia timonensis]|uniref:helix-turn-helix domain-containing protein n=1 Tax=Emergencia timonensis TaxID=1776384 RepID=UPI001D06F5FF|nr:helix-turn-helix transcriptional regulator [Emergencia timonensis]MCB6477563.1 helix-turn-helix transcriptional regulator [Emergencia timonensis]